MPTVTYRVDGMTCAHCVNAITEEIERIAGVQQVQVVLDAGTVTITSAEGLPVGQIRAAVDEAGYTVTDA